MHQITLSCLSFTRKRFKHFLMNDPKSSSRQPNIKMDQVDILKYKTALVVNEILVSTPSTLVLVLGSMLVWVISTSSSSWAAKLFSHNSQFFGHHWSMHEAFKLGDMTMCHNLKLTWLHVFKLEGGANNATIFNNLWYHILGLGIRARRYKLNFY